ncbi:terminase large subunit domain-containing protein [Anaerophilus nitritogenes]|uniref:phage terminase large subunit family protein n=1 Tax=Anaerophilus nitritogenes TaxID=2498136 RepID=UPI00101E1FA2|nr:terminase family protein [Anaerophilus nitritogenes]
MAREVKSGDKKAKLRRILSDPTLYIESFLQIADKNGKIVPFKLNPQQRYLVENMKKYNVVLKSRQLGISSLTTALSLYYACTKPNTTSLLLSYSIDSANGIFDKLKQLYYDMPSVLKPSLFNNNKKELKFSNGSKIVVATNGNKDVARGLTLNGIVHISEMAFMKETIEKNLLAIEQATSSDAIIIVESTANGLNFFNEFWTKAENNENMYKPFFFSWIDDKIMFADEYKQFKNVWIDRKGKMLTKADLDNEELDLHSKGATLEQLIWRRLKISNSSEEQFKQEFPSNPMEAFLTSGNSIFDVNYIAERSRYLDKHIKKPTDLPECLRHLYGRSFFMWKKPVKGAKYYIGVDSGEGLKQDYSVVEVLDSEGEQVAEFRSNTIKPYQFAEITNDIGRYYNYAYMVVEKASAGHTVLDRLRHDYNYMNLHKHKEYDTRGRKKKKIGFNTTSQSKTMIINDLVEWIETGQLLINSKYVLEEMKVFVVDGGKMGAMKGRHDDTIMAIAMALHGLKTGIWYI